MTFFKWSKVAASNATADSTCPFPEGMAASALNDGTRGMMAAAAKYRDDIAGATVTAGTSTAYTLGTNEIFDTLLNLNGQMVAFTPHATNGATVTFNVDSLGAKPLRSAPGVELLAGTLILGTPYVAVYNNTDGVFYLQGYYSSPYNVPFLGGMDYWDTIAPNSAFIFPLGQALSRTVYVATFLRWGTTYGVGDGTTTFNAPDKSGRVSAMKEAAASRLSAAYFGGNSTNMGAVGGADNQTLTAAQIPAINSSGNNLIIVDSDRTDLIYGGTSDNFQSIAGAGQRSNISSGQQTSRRTNAIAVSSINTGGQPHTIVQPTIVCNYIIRVL